MEKKICSKCKEEKEVCEFGKDKTKKSGYKSQCKKCANITTKKYKLLNPDKIKLSRKKTYEKHFDIISIKKKEYARKNKIKDNLRRKNKYHADPSYKLKVNLRRRISFYLKSKNIIKTNTTFDIIGCSPEFLKEHIEKQFTEGMSWDLLGKHIHIDHIIPLSSAKNENELYELCRYTNLQPLWAEDNLKKSNKIL
jgi:hypothetical protein